MCGRSGRVEIDTGTSASPKVRVGRTKCDHTRIATNVKSLLSSLKSKTLYQRSLIIDLDTRHWHLDMQVDVVIFASYFRTVPVSDGLKIRRFEYNNLQKGLELCRCKCNQVRARRRPAIMPPVYAFASALIFANVLATSYRACLRIFMTLKRSKSFSALRLSILFLLCAQGPSSTCFSISCASHRFRSGPLPVPLGRSLIIWGMSLIWLSGAE